MERKCDTALRHDVVSGGEVAPRREKAGEDASWADPNLTELKNKENPHGRFSEDLKNNELID
jgi:hypothetical protein